MPAPAPLRLVVDGDEPAALQLDVFLRRARAVMGEPGEPRAFDPYRDAEPA